MSVILLLLSIDLLSVVWIIKVFRLARATCSSAGESIASAAASTGFASPRTVYDLNVFFAPTNLGIDTKIITFVVSAAILDAILK